MSSRSYGTTDRCIASASSHPGRIRIGATISASSTDASTALLPTGRSTAAQTLRVATSTAMVSSGRAVTPSASTTSTSNGVLSIITSSPGRNATVGTNGGCGLEACQRRCAALPNSP
ncbi:hypothetical protein [Streptomyces nigrescens]